MLRYVAVVFALVAVSLAQDFDAPAPAPRPAPPRIQPGYSGSSSRPAPTPVPIIKQIDRHNEDGSYTYGYESADGSFKIETKLPTGEVKGKYGYVDDTGKVRVIEYGATKHGFAPAGEGITVPPPTLVDETTDKEGALLPEYDYNDQQDANPLPSRAQSQNNAYNLKQSSNGFEFSSAPRPAPRPAPIEEYSPPQTFEPSPPITRPIPRPAPKYAPQSFEPAPLPARAPPSASGSFTLDFPTRSVPVSRPAFSPAPAPPRPSFANAAPVPLEDYGSLPPRPAPKFTVAQTAPLPARPAPQPSFAPIPRPAPIPQYRPAPQPGGRAGGSILDQLSKDYALPSGGAATTHDITFGYF